MDPDAQLLARISEKDQQAFSSLYDAYAPRVYGLLLTLVRQRTDADDLLQEVMWEVYKNAAKYRPELGSVATWVLMIARSRAIDAIRRTRSREDTLRKHADNTGASASQDLGTLDRERLSPAIARAIETLPAEQAEALMLAYARGMSREEIAAARSVPVGTIKTRIRSAVRRLGAVDGSSREALA